jgi:hypothetical protein
MAEHALGVVGKHPVDLCGRVAAMRQQKLERGLTPCRNV